MCSLARSDQKETRMRLSRTRQLRQIGSFTKLTRAMAAPPPPNTAFPPATHASTAAAAGRPFEIDDEPSFPTAAMPDAPPPPVPPVADGADPSAAENNGDALMGGVSVGGDGENGGKAVMGAGTVQVSMQWRIVEGPRVTMSGQALR